MSCKLSSGRFPLVNWLVCFLIDKRFPLLKQLLVLIKGPQEYFFSHGKKKITNKTLVQLLQLMFSWEALIPIERTFI